MTCSTTDPMGNDMIDTTTLDAKDLQTYYNGQGRRPPDRPEAPVFTRGEPGRYLADPQRLVPAVRTAIALSRPLLVTGEPGTGKTSLAWSIAWELDLGEVLEFHTRSDNKARDLFYTFDPVRRFYHAQVRDPRAADPWNYVEPGPLGRAFCGETRRVVLIDEIDKAPRDFHNDLLDALDRMYFTIDEVDPDRQHQAKLRPIIVITSNRDKQLPDPFLRRCIFHCIRFPGPEMLKRILDERLGGPGRPLDHTLVEAAIRRHAELRDKARRGELERPPGTDELVVWVRMLMLSGVPVDTIARSTFADLPYVGALLKTVKDHDTIDREARSAAAGDREARSAAATG